MSELELREENKKLKQVIEKMANEIYIEYTPHFVSTEAVIDFYMNLVDLKKAGYCSASNNECCTCREEKMGCKNCFYYKEPHKQKKGTIQIIWR